MSLAHVIDNRADFHLGNLRPATIGTYIAELLRLQSQLEWVNPELL